MSAQSKSERCIREVIKPYGYTIIQTRRHKKIIDKDGRHLLSIGTSPSDRNWHKNVLLKLRRYGYIDKED